MVISESCHEFIRLSTHLKKRLINTSSVLLRLNSKNLLHKITNIKEETMTNFVNGKINC